MDWLDKLFSSSKRNIFLLIVGAAFGALLKQLFTNLSLIAALLSLVGGFLILVVQESESADLKREIEAIAGQVDDLVARRPVNQSTIGTLARLGDHRRAQVAGRWKSAGLFCLMLGFAYSVL